VRKILGFIVLGTTALATLHCSGDDGDTGTSSASTSTSTGSGSTPLDCSGACDKVVALGCKDDTKAACLAECEGAQKESAECRPKFDALYACVVDNLACGMDGMATISDKELFDVCTDQLLDVEVCSYCQVRATDDACEQCRAKECCDEATAAYTDPNVVPLTECMAGCKNSGEQCLLDCQGKFPDAFAKYVAFMQCEDDGCVKECEATPEPTGGGFGGNGGGAGGAGSGSGGSGGAGGGG